MVIAGCGYIAIGGYRGLYILICRPSLTTFLFSVAVKKSCEGRPI